jgi:predicted phosphoribosyltransferase
MHALFQNREDAGQKLAEKLEKYRNSNAVVLGIPRGGIALGYEVAKELHLPLDIVLSKKIGHPLSPEFAIGSVSLDTVVLDEHPGISEDYIDNEIHRIRLALKEKQKLYEGTHTPIEIRDKPVIIVDDGIATGNTLLATVQLLRKSGASFIVAATPVIPSSRVSAIEKKLDELIYLAAPEYFPGVGIFYQDFEQVNDEEVVMLLELNRVQIENNDTHHV